MKKIGIIGGLSWESSKKYYQKINQKINKKLGDNNYAKIVLYSLNFGVIEKLQKRDRWQDVYEKIYKAARFLEKTEVDFIVIASNTIHKIYNKLETNLSTPLYHIVDGLKYELKGLDKAGILGTSYTINGSFIADRIKRRYAVDIIKPDDKNVKILDEIIFKNLVKSKITEKNELKFKEILKYFENNSIKNIILACTELQLMIKKNSYFSKFNFIDTLEEHCNLIVEEALN